MYVNTPVELSYAIAPSPLADPSAPTDKSVNAILEAPLLIHQLASSAITQALPLYFKILPLATPDVLTSDNAPILAADILASALAFVKYKFVPSGKSAVSFSCPHLNLVESRS